MITRTMTRPLSGFVLFAALTIAASLYAAQQQAEPGNSRRPNILLIIGDDIGLDVTTNMYPGLIDSLSNQYGPQGHHHPRYRMITGRPASTPNLESLAKSGMKFTQVWAQPYCSPTRTSLITGLFAAKTGVLDYEDALSKTHRSFVKDLRDKGGYSTAAFGKWHIAGLIRFTGMLPKEAGFELYYGNLSGGVRTYFDYAYHVQDSRTFPNRYRTERPPTVSLPGIAPTTFAPVVKTHNTIRWIEEQERENPDKPWFAYLSFNLSHISGQQQPNPMVIPNADTMDDVSRKEIEECMGPEGQFGSATVGSCSSEVLMRAMTNTMDTMIGRVVETVDKLDPNTYIIYLSDNGTWMFGPQRQFIDNMYITRRGRDKGTAFESGVRVAMVIRGPGITAETTCDQWVHSTDLFSTVLDLAGLDVPKMVPDKTGNGMVEVDSVSLAPALFQSAKNLRDPDQGYLLAETINPLKGNRMEVAARNATYKVICANNANTESCTFYNLIDDPLEEYPLEKPTSNTRFKDGTWTPDDPEWHFCHLQEVIATKSFLASPPPPKKSQAAPFPKKKMRFVPKRIR